jgi:hypothetical protein
MKTLKKISAFLNRIFIFVASLALVLMMLLGFGNVLLRTVWKPIEGTYELIGFLGSVTTALALGYAQIRKNHISVDIITSHYSKRWKKLFTASVISPLLSFSPSPPGKPRFGATLCGVPANAPKPCGSSFFPSSMSSPSDSPSLPLSS